jgi:hypothetical protein
VTGSKDWSDVVRANALLTTGYLLAWREPCIGLGHADAHAATGRRFVAITEPPSALPDSWTMAVLLCTGDTTDELARFAKGLAREAWGRIRFYEAGSVAPSAFRAWLDRGLPVPFVIPIKDWKQLHRDFGRFVNEWTFQDAVATR